MLYAIKVNQIGEGAVVSRMCADFIRALLEQGHQVRAVFFYHSGVEVAFNQQMADDCGWGELSAEASINLVYCSSAATARNLRSNSCLPYFVAGGLGIWIDACLSADRVISFGDPRP